MNTFDGFISREPPELPSNPNDGDFSIGGNVFFGSNLEVLGSVGIGTTAPLGPLQVGSGSSVFVITQSGSVGIGTAIPGNCGILEVVGTVCATDFNSTSDISLKENIKVVSDPLSKVIKLNGVSFDWKETKKGSYGVIAQELEQVFPELVKGNTIKTVNYNGIIAVLIESIKELNQKVEGLTKEVNDLRMKE